MDKNMTCFEQTAAYVPDKAVVRVFLFLQLDDKVAELQYSMGGASHLGK